MRNLLKRLVKALPVALAAVLALALPVLAYTYRATYTVTESSGTSYAMLPVVGMANNSWMASNGFISATALDTRVQTVGGSNKPHMVADDKVLTAIPVTGSSQTNLYYVAGESALPAMDIILGRDGYMTTADAAALEPAANATFSYKGAYIGTGSGNLGSKANALTWSYDVTTANVTASVWGGYYSPTSAAGGSWVNHANAIDGDTGTSATFSWAGPGAVWSGALAAPYTSTIRITAIQYWITDPGGTCDQIDVDYYDGVWNDLYLGAPTTGSYVTLAYVGNVSSVRVNAHLTAGGNTQIHELRYVINSGTSLSTSLTGISPGVYSETTMSLTTANLVVTVGTSSNSTALGSYVVNDTSGVYTWMASNTVAYADNFTMAVGGNTVLQYEPAAIISGTTMPDRAGTAQDATIVWGANPTGVVVALGSMVSSGQASVGTTPTEAARDVLPEVEIPDLYSDGTVSGTALTSPLRPFVTAISDNTTLTELQTWRWLGGALWLLIVILCMRSLKEHQGITAVIASVVLGVYVIWNHNIFPGWLLIVAIAGFIGGLVAERSPSL